MHYQRLALAASLAVLLSACATAPRVMEPLPGATPEGEIAAIVTTAHEAEIQQGQAAAGRATSEDVRAFAQMLVTDHTTALNNARDTFNRAGINSADNNVATTLRGNSQTTVTNLGTYRDAAFDRAFIQHQVDQHAWLLDALDAALTSARTPELRTLLQNQRASVAAHLDRARQIQGGLR